MFSAAFTAFYQIFQSPFRRIFWRSIGITIMMIVITWLVLKAVLYYFFNPPGDVAETGISFLAAISVIIAFAYLIGPITSLVAGFFLDETAEIIEEIDYPDHPPGHAAPFAESLWLTIKFAAVVMAVNTFAYLSLLLPGISIVAFLFANGYLLGREYFELAAMRYMPKEQVKALREEHRLQVFACGLVITGFLVVPFLNLMTPLFATIYMVHVVKRLS